MKNLKLLMLLFAMVAFTFTSCDDSDDVQDIPVEQIGEVEFDLTNFGASIAQLNNKTAIPECSDLAASYVEATILHPDGTVETYTIDVIPLMDNNSNGMQTKVLKLKPGLHTIQDFAVYAADDTVIFASPDKDSQIATQWELTGTDLDFTVTAFKKTRVDIDVLCYIPANWEEFGFSWFQFAKHQIKEVCFFGDVCTKFYDEWHNENSPYFGDAYDGYDFPARFQVHIYETTGGANILRSTTEHNGDGPLCIEFVDNLQVLNESYTAVIDLMMPDGNYMYLGEVDFDENTYSDVDLATDNDPNTNVFGGDDGIWDFSVGDCLNDESDGDFEFPAWVPAPTVGEFKVSGGLYPTIGGYIKSSFRLLDVEHPQVMQNGVDLPVFCAAELDDIYKNQWYPANFYVLLGDDAVAAATANPALTQLRIDALNWIANNMDGFTAQQIQKAIWHVMGTEPANTLGTQALGQAGYTPKVGGYVIVVADAIENAQNSDGVVPRQNGPIQIMVAQVDP